MESYIQTETKSSSHLFAPSAVQLLKGEVTGDRVVHILLCKDLVLIETRRLFVIFNVTHVLFHFILVNIALCSFRIFYEFSYHHHILYCFII